MTERPDRWRLPYIRGLVLRVPAHLFDRARTWWLQRREPPAEVEAPEVGVLRYGPVAVGLRLDGLTVDDPVLARLPGRLVLGPAQLPGDAPAMALRRVPAGIAVVVGPSVTEPVPDADLAGPVLAQLTRWLLAAEDGWTHLHAAVLALDDRGVVVAGSSGTGKTTLVAVAAAEGVPVLNDEIVAVDRSAGLLRAVERPLSIKPEGRHWVRTMTDAEPPDGDRLWWLDVAELGGHRLDTVAPGLIVVVDRRSGPVSWEPITRAEALVHLIEHAYDVTVDPGDRLRDLAWLASCSRTVRVGYDDAREALPVLAELAAAVPEPGTVGSVTAVDPRSAPSSGAALAAHPGVHAVVIDGRAVLHDEVSGRVIALDERGTELWKHPERALDDERDRGFVDELVALGVLVEGERG